MIHQPSPALERIQRRICVAGGALGIPFSLLGFVGVYFGVAHQPGITLLLLAVLLLIASLMLWAGIAPDSEQPRRLRAGHLPPV